MKNDTNLTTPTSGRPTLLSKPSLASRDTDPADGWEGSRILSNPKMGALGKSPQKRSKPRAPASGWRIAGTVTLAALLAVAGAVGYESLQEPQTRSTQILPPTEGTQVAQTGGEPLTAQAAQAAQAAQIINEPVPAPVPVQTSENKLTAALENGVPPPPAALEKALHAAAPSSQKTKTKKAEPRKANVTNKKVQPANKTAAKAATAVERDINLLAALVAHNNATAANTVPDVGAEALIKRCSLLKSNHQAACRAKACAGPRASEPSCNTPAQPIMPSL